MLSIAHRLRCIKSYDKRESRLVLTNFQEFEEPQNGVLGEGHVVKALRSGRAQMNMLFPGTEV